MNMDKTTRLAERLVYKLQKLQHAMPNDRLNERCKNAVLEIHYVLRMLKIINEDEK